MKTNPLHLRFCDHLETGIKHLVAVHGHEGEAFHSLRVKPDGSQSGWAKTSYCSRFFRYDYPEHDAPEMLRVQMFGHSVTIDTSDTATECRDIESAPYGAATYAGEY